MWIILALLSALFAGITSILSKIGIKDVNSNLATAIRTTVVLINSWILVFITNSNNSAIFENISTRSLIFLILSGLSTGGAWLCYFKALQIGNINWVVPIDKSSTVLTIILAFIFLNETINLKGILAIICILIGTYSMISWKKEKVESQNGWLKYALLSAIFSSFTSILGKIGVENINSNLATAIRTIVVFIFAWLIVIFQNRIKEISKIDKRTWLFLILSGFATGASWLCFYSALKLGRTSVVVSIDKLSLVVTVLFSQFIFGEKLDKKSYIGLLLIMLGTFLLI